jgi:hypothetical protein
MLFFTKTYGTNATVALAETQLVLVDHQHTVGQVFYTNAVGSNGSINQGAQQPVEILH